MVWSSRGLCHMYNVRFIQVSLNWWPHYILTGSTVLCCDWHVLFVCVSDINMSRCNKWVTVRYMARWQSLLSTVCVRLLHPSPPPTQPPLHSGSGTGNTCSHVPRLQEPAESCDTQRGYKTVMTWIERCWGEGKNERNVYLIIVYFKAGRGSFV